MLMDTPRFYSTKSQGIGGQIKRRYSDFVVEERTPNGRLCEVKRFLAEGEIEFNALKIPENEDAREFTQLHVDLEKINKDLNFAISKITRFLGCSRNRVGYAGMKDKRAVTCQRISLFKPDVERLEKFSSRGIELRNPAWEKERIDLGMLQGNKFTIIIRDISLDEKELKKRVGACFKEMRQGIANYFGEQRFGGIRMISHIVGKEFIKGNYREAVMLYLTAIAPGEEEELKAAREALAQSGDFSRASREFPVKYRYERAMIHHLCKYPNDFVGAFQKLPKQLRYLFTHAYQSYLFNKIIDRRIEEGIGLKRQEEDVLVNDLPSAQLLGFESDFSGGKVGEIERGILEEEGISLGQFKVKSFPELSSKGSRKEIVLIPRNLKLVEIKDDEFYEGKKCAKIAFELTKGNYATTVLRELMKAD